MKCCHIFSALLAVEFSLAYPLSDSSPTLYTRDSSKGSTYEAVRCGGEFLCREMSPRSRNEMLTPTKKENEWTAKEVKDSVGRAKKAIKDGRIVQEKRINGAHLQSDPMTPMRY